MRSYTSGEMEALTLLLMFFTLPGCSHVLQPGLTVMQTAVSSRSEQLRDVALPDGGRQTSAESTEGRTADGERRSDRLSPETNPARWTVRNRMTAGGRRREDGLTPERGPDKTMKRQEKMKTMRGRQKTLGSKKGSKEASEGRREEYLYTANDRGTQKKGEEEDEEEEEREGMLVAGIRLHQVTRGDALKPGNVERQHREAFERAGEERTAKRNEEREHDDYREVRSPEPSASTSAEFRGESKLPAIIQIITQAENPQSSPPLLLPVTPTHRVSSHPPTPDAGPRSFPPSVSPPRPTEVSHILTVAPGDVKYVSMIEDLLTEVLESPGRHVKQKELQVKAGPDLEDDVLKMMLRKLAGNLQTTHRAADTGKVMEPIESDVSKQRGGTFTTKEESNPEPKVNDNTVTVKPVRFTLKPKAVQDTGNGLKPTVKQHKASPEGPQWTKVELTTSKTPSGKKKKFKEKGTKKINKTQKPWEGKEEVTTPAHFPYFKDDYCPPDCACYGRVIQCSDKGVDKIPYGIPFNARYILLMNNHIDSIQLDLLSEYVSMEFLVLSNNRLTDGAVEGAFEGVAALKRLYLDRNLLLSVPTDLPASLEELRLDNNQLSVMSEGAWARCPGLLVLSLSNNSLNGSESLPNGVFSPLGHLRTLKLDHNQLTSVPLGLPLSIKELYLKGNLIEHFIGGAFDGTSELLVLDLSANRLTNKGLPRDALLKATHLESLNLEGNRLKQVPRHLPLSLKTLNLEGNLISSIKKEAFSTLKNLEHLGLARNKISKVVAGAFRELPVLHQLDLCHNSLRQVPRQLPQGLHSVALTHNKIQSVPRDAFCWGDAGLGPSGLVRVQLENNVIDLGKLDSQAFRCLRGSQVLHFY